MTEIGKDEMTDIEKKEERRLRVRESKRGDRDKRDHGNLQGSIYTHDESEQTTTAWDVSHEEGEAESLAE